MFCFNVILLSDVISSIGPKISDADTYFLFTKKLLIVLQKNTLSLSLAYWKCVL